MLLPDVKLNINSKYVVLSITSICAVGLLILIGYSLALKPKSVVCKSYIDEARVSQEHIKSLEKELSTSKDIFLTECITREKEICSDLVKATTEGLRKLRCKICASQGVR